MKLSDYRTIVGDTIIDELELIGQKLSGRIIKNINSTAVGGGVAEILNRMVPLLKNMGIEAQWDVIRGDDQFFAVTKKIHNALQGSTVELTSQDKEIYWNAQEANKNLMNFDADIIFVHDPQPAGLIELKQNIGKKWLWRCHIDLSNPNPMFWDFFKPMIERYDASVFSAPPFARQLSIPQIMITPSIDPLSDKNKELDPSYIKSILDQFGINRKKPLITQVSRFDYAKDPVGVIKAYHLVKPYIDCQLVLVGGSATDDPEGASVLAHVKEAAGNDADIHVLELPPTSHLEINAIQRASTIILQKSLKEGFGLTVSEALWKGKPVIAGGVGGIPLQITHKYSGILTHSIEGTAYWIKQLLQEPKYAQTLGENGREHVRENFLVTRHLRDYMLLFLLLDHQGKEMIYL
jgi:trehalose synthase